MIVCHENDYHGEYTWEVETHAVSSSYTEMFMKYKTFDSWEEHTRTCDYCGKNYDQGYMAGSGEYYACEECFEHFSGEFVGPEELPDDQKWKANNPDGGCYFQKNVVIDDTSTMADPLHIDYWDTGWYYTEWGE